MTLVKKKIVYPNRLNNEYDLYIQNPISKLLSSFQNLNLNNSSSFYSNDILHFNLEFKSSEQLNATASGIYNSKSSSLKINIKYLFENEITKNGKIIREKYEMNIDIKADKFEDFNLTKNIEKEKIDDFLFRLLSEISKELIEEDKIPIALVLDSDDFQELASLKKGKIIKLIFAILQTAYFTSKIKQMINKNYSPEYSILHPVRKSDLVFNMERKETKNFELKIELQKISENFVEFSSSEVPA
jgi:hypothetical protein